MITLNQLNAEGRRLAACLKQHDLKIVFAESCTGGLVSATLTRVPGISAYHCGSAVVYQIETKSAWLGISAKMLDKPGAVSRVVAVEMARNVLRKTPHADLSASVTGHLGPRAPKRQDGLVYIAVAFRTGRRRTSELGVSVKRIRLEAAPGTTARSLRNRRQREAAFEVLRTVCTHFDH